MKFQHSIRVTFGLTVLGLAVLGCGDDSDSSSKRPPILEAPRVTSTAESLRLTSTSSEPRLVGSWNSECLKNPDGSSVKVTVDITDRYMQQTNALFTDGSCSQPVLDARFIASYTADKAKIQTTLKESHVQVKNGQFALAAQSGSSCGFNRWQSYVWYNLTDKVCVKSANGIWISPTKAGSQTTVPYTIKVNGRFTELDMGGGLIVKRPLRANDDGASPGTPVTVGLFADPKEQAVESYLKLWGCTISQEQGISNCPAPRNLSEASQLVDNIIAFGFAISSDANFRNNEAAQAKLRAGYSAEFEKVRAFPAYADVLRSVIAGTESLKAIYPEFYIGVVYNVNALQQAEALKTLKAAFETLNAFMEFRRLNVTHIYISSHRSYYADKERVMISVDHNGTAADLIAFLQAQTPKTLTPAP